MSKTPLDHALDLFVFAPLGAVFTARDALPELIDKGRERLGGQVSAARMMGQMAVSQGQREAEKAVAEANRRLAGLGLIPDTRRASGADDAAADQVDGDTAAVAPTGVSPEPTEPMEPAVPGVSAEDLAIPGYDSLSAPQVVQRLAGLSAEELDAVRSYEAATRRRKTILTRISQLQDPAQS